MMTKLYSYVYDWATQKPGFKEWKTYGRGPCSCCGMSFETRESKSLEAKNGIAVFNDKYGEEKVVLSTDWTRMKQITHVETKNGPITVVTEHVNDAAKKVVWLE
jgi:hypothetical protein